MKKLLYILLYICSLASCAKEQVEQDTITIADDYVYNIPLIFHVIHNDNQITKVSSNTINEIVEGCNNIFRNRYSPYNSVDMNVEFTLADKNPSGAPLSEPGINRISLNYTKLSADDFLRDNSNTKYLWDQNKYINICLFAFSEHNIIGISYLPFTDSSNPLKGLSFGNVYYNYNTYVSYPHSIVLNSNFIGNIYYRNISISSTAHELGHYLGLKHVFHENDVDETPINNYRKAQDNDHCDDTYTYDRNEYINHIKTNISDRYYRTDPFTNKKVLADNYMDYDYCEYTRFTSDQRARVRHVLMYSPLIPGPKIIKRNITKSVTISDDKPISIIAY